MKALTNNTLIEISRHSNKVLKLATYMAKSEQPMLLDNIYMIEDTTSQKEALESFQKDFDKTVDLIEKSHQLLSTVKIDGIVEQLDNNEKNISVIFEEKYNKDSFKLELSSISLNLKSSIEKDFIRNSIMSSVLDIDYPTFKDFIKNVDKIYKLDESSLETEEDAIEYLSTLAYREQYDVIIEKIKNIAGEFSEYRNSLGLNNRNLIDNEITFSRSMIDSVMKNSTYITKDAIEQISSPHKKNMNLVNDLHEFIVSNNYINAIEIDPDTNIKSVLDILQKTNDLKLNIKEQFTLKCRKLGNYNANGLYLPRMHIAAVDISNPSALIHELTHAADISNPDLYNHILREEIINKYKQMIDVNDLEVRSRMSYYLNNEEVIARLGEISYILSKYEYNGENFEDFINKVKIDEKEFNSDYLNIAKPIDTYLKRSNIYFNFEKMNKSDLLEIKSYFTSYFGVNNDEIKPVYSEFINYESKKSIKGRRVENKFKDSPYVKLDTNSVVKALDYNYEHKIIPFNQLFLAISENIHMIARRKKTLTMGDLNNQLDTTSLIYDWVANKNDIDIKAELIKSFYILSKGAGIYHYIPLKLSLKFANTIEEMNKVKSITNACDNINYIRSGNPLSTFRKSHQTGLGKVLKTIDFDNLFKRMEISDPITHTFLFSDKSIELFSSLTGKKWAENGDKLLAAYQEKGVKEVFETINNSSLYGTVLDGYIALSKEQSKFILDNSLKSFKSGVRSAENCDEELLFGVHNGKRCLTSNIERIKRTNLFNNCIIEENNDGIRKISIDFIKLNTENILGKEKIVNENFKDIRKKLLEKTLEELKTKQKEKVIETINEPKKVVVENTSKIQEEILDNSKVLENKTTVVDKPTENKLSISDIINKRKNEILEEVTKKQKPINPDKTNQFKLF